MSTTNGTTKPANDVLDSSAWIEVLTAGPNAPALLNCLQYGELT